MKRIILSLLLGAMAISPRAQAIDAIQAAKMLGAAAFVGIGLYHACQSDVISTEKKFTPVDNTTWYQKIRYAFSTHPAWTHYSDNTESSLKAYKKLKNIDSSIEPMDLFSTKQGPQITYNGITYNQEKITQVITNPWYSRLAWSSLAAIGSVVFASAFEK